MNPAHSVPPLPHERLRELIQGADPVIRSSVAAMRKLHPSPLSVELDKELLAQHEPFYKLIERSGHAVYERTFDRDEALAEVEIVGSHLFYAVAFELGLRKTFWVDGAVSWMLRRTELDIQGEALKLPFPAFALVFTDEDSLEVARALLVKDPAARADPTPLQSLTVYVVRIPADGAYLGLSLSVVIARAGDGWPYVLWRNLYVRAADHLDGIVDSSFPDVGPDRDPVFSSPELRDVVKLAVNAILYATSADVQWQERPSKVSEARRSAQGRGDKKKRRTEARVSELRRSTSAEDVYFLPGHVSIRQLKEGEQNASRGDEGGAAVVRTLVRGHWRRPAAGWKDQRVRWIAPYWKGPENAVVVERPYRLET